MHNKLTEKIIRKNGQLLVINLYLCLMERNINYNDGDILIKDSFGDIFLAGTIRTTMVSAVICTAGQVSFSLGGTTYTAMANDIVILPPNLSIDDVAFDNDFDGLFFALSYVKFEKTIMSGRGLWPLMMYTRTHPIIHMNKQEMKLALDYFSIVREKIASPRDFYYKEIMLLLMETVFYEICVIINRHIDTNVLTVIAKQKDLVFRKFIDLLSTESIHSRTVADYAKMLCVSPKYLSHAVQSLSGKNALTWILEYATDAIAHELRYSDRSIKEIAHAFEFSSISAFSKFVRIRLGCSPRDFRNKAYDSETGQKGDCV